MTRIQNQAGNRASRSGRCFQKWGRHLECNVAAAGITNPHDFTVVLTFVLRYRQRIRRQPDPRPPDIKFKRPLPETDLKPPPVVFVCFVNPPHLPAMTSKSYPLMGVLPIAMCHASATHEEPWASPVCILPDQKSCDKQVSSWRHISCHTDKNRYYT